MKALITILFIIILPAMAVSQVQERLNYVEIRGKALVKVVPDLIYLRVNLSERQKNRIDLEAKEKQMMEKLRGIGIELKDIVVKDLASSFNAKMFTDDNIVISKEFVVCVHDAKTANRVISDLKAVEISNIRVDHLDHTRLTDFRKEATVKAMVAAKAKAEAITQSIGQSIGKAIYIEEQMENPYVTLQASNATYEAEYKMPELDFNEISLECMLLARFELK